MHYRNVLLGCSSSGFRFRGGGFWPLAKVPDSEPALNTGQTDQLGWNLTTALPRGEDEDGLSSHHLMHRSHKCNR